LEAAVRALVEGHIDVVALTTGVQLVHLLHVAGDMGLEQAARHALAGTVIASIGPMTTEEILRQGLTPDLEASNSKMGYLVKEAAEQSAALLSGKRSTLR
jgi:uroporphyrinogen-III synthase